MLLASFIAALAFAAPAHAQTGGVIGQGGLSLDEMVRQVDASLPPYVGNPEIVGQMLKAPIGDPLSKTFSLSSAVRLLFGFSTPTYAPDCSRNQTAANEPDQGDCLVTFGTPGGEGALKQLSVSKNLGVGNIRWLTRPGIVDPMKLVPPTLDDAGAQKVAQNFLFKFFTISQVEVPQPPADAKNPFSVGHLMMNSGDEQGAQGQPVLIGLLVVIARGLNVNLTDPASGKLISSYVPAPGTAKVLIGGGNQVTAAMLEDWQELRLPDPASLQPKSRQDLVNEIARDLLGDGGGRIAKFSAHVHYVTDWRGSYGMLLPAVQVEVTPVSGDLNSDQFAIIERNNIGTAATVRSYELVDHVEPPAAPSR